MRENKTAELHFTLESIEDFLWEMEQLNHSEGTRKMYRSTLLALYHSLPDEKLLSSQSADTWRAYLEAKGYAPRTIRSKISVLNSYLQYAGRREWQFDQPSASLPVDPETDIQPELTRPEYLRMLQAARLLERHRTYLLIKTLGGMDMRIQELPQFTMESLQAGTAPLWYRGAKRMAYIPASLRRELLDYAEAESIRSGTIFITKDGDPLNRAVVWRSINAISDQAGISPKKANPRCLRKLYISTRSDLPGMGRDFQNRAYDRMLEREQKSVGWQS